MTSADYVRVGRVAFGDRGTLRVGVVAGDPDLGDVVVVGKTSPSSGDLLLDVPAGRVFVGELYVVLAVGELGLAVSDSGGELIGLQAGGAPEPLVGNVSVTVAGGSRGNSIRVSRGGRGHGLVWGHVRDLA